MPTSAARHEHTAALDDCDGYVVVVIDPATAEVDAYGPLEGLASLRDADRRRRELDDEGLHDVAVTVVRLHQR